MDEMSFANYILAEKSLSEKMRILLYFKRKHEFFFDNTVIFKVEITRLFLEHCRLEGIDINQVLTQCLMYGCKKTAISFDMQRVKTYAKEGAEYLATLGFDDKFCKSCLEVNRYNDSKEREKEGDILELIDNFGMLLDRDDRRAFTPVEALFILENDNLQAKQNRYLQDFKEFIMEFENIESVGLDKNKIITTWQNSINSIPKYDVIHGIDLAIQNRNQARRMYIEGKRIERDDDGIRTNKQKINAQRRLHQELAQEIDKNHKFSDLLEKNTDIS